MGHSTQSKMLGTTALAGAISGILAGTAVHAAEIIDVPQQELIAAIEELSQETGKSIAVNRDAIGVRTSQAVQGTISAKDALEIMIGDPGLSVSELSDGSLVVVRSNFVSQNLNDVPFDLGTIVVQGERVEREVFETTSSIRAYGSEELEENVQNTDVEEVISNAANLTVFGGSNQTPYIRGQSTSGPNDVQGAFLEGSFPRANLTVDGRIQTFSEFSFSSTSVWDVETIEVFRGPQTTTQGSNSIAGAINVRTKDPIFFRESAFRAEIGSDQKRVASAMINVPVSESVALRFSVDYQEQEPFINYPAGFPAGSDVRKADQTTARLKLLWEPVELPEFSTKLTLSYTDYSGPQTQNVVAPFEELNSSNTDGFPSAFYGNTFAAIHDISYEFGNGLSVRNQLTYSDAANTRTTNGGPGILSADRPLDTKAVSNEFIFDIAPEGSPLTGLLGVFARKADDSSPGSTVFNVDGTNENLGIFGEATYRFENGFDLTGGLRYERTKQQRNVEIPSFGLVGASALDYDAKFDAVLPKIAIGYQPDDDLRFALQVSRGFNPGGVGTSLGAIFGLIPLPSPFVEFDEETVTSYEFSMRGRFLEDRLFVGANLFFSDFDDYQFSIATVLPTGDIDSIISNAERVETYGLEVDAQFQANDRLQLTGSLGLLHSEVKQHDSAAISIVGNELAFAPEVTASLGLDYAITDRLFVGGQVRYSAGYFSDIANTAANEVSSLTLVDLQARYAVTDAAELYAYVNNVADTVQGVEKFGNGTSGVTNRPREFGFGVRARF